jgi:S1-C subfamily serine protease
VQCLPVEGNGRTPDWAIPSPRRGIAHWPLPPYAFYPPQMSPDTYERLGLIQRNYDVNNRHSGDALADEYTYTPTYQAELLFQFVFTGYAAKFMQARTKCWGQQIGTKWEIAMMIKARLLRIALAVTLALGLLRPAAQASDIDGCKYLIVTDFTSDPYGIAQELRAQAREHGFDVVSNPSDVSEADRLKACVMAGSWNQRGYSGNVAVRVVDAASGNLLGEANASGTAWGTAKQTVRGIVGKLYHQLGYTGYSEAVYQDRLHRLFPPRPQLKVTEAQIRSAQQQNAVEGIWTDPENKYRLGIVKAPEGSGADYVAVVLQSGSPVWQPDEIKAEIRTTASPLVFTSTYFMANKRPSGTTLLLEHDSELKGSVSTPNGTLNLLLLRVWPPSNGEPIRTSSEQGGKTGSGFLIARTGLIATNWHVVSDSKRITVSFPKWKEPVSAEVVVRDTTNDLAILRVTDAGKLTDACPDLPFQLVPAKGVVLGEQVSTVGYPLSPFLGSNPKFSEGVISAMSGLQDDPRLFQISAAVQPGSSGSPLFDHEGNVVGIVVASLDAAKVYQLTSAIPQNVNWAIKSDYLLNLAGMIPDEKTISSRTITFTPDKAAACVALITAW